MAKKYENETPEEKLERLRSHRRNYDARNPEKRRARRNRSRRKLADRELARLSRWRAENHERAKAIGRKSYHKNKDKHRERRNLYDRMKRAKIRAEIRANRQTFGTKDDAETAAAKLRMMNTDPSIGYGVRKLTNEEAYYVRRFSTSSLHKWST